MCVCVFVYNYLAGIKVKISLSKQINREIDNSYFLMYSYG